MFKAITATDNCDVLNEITPTDCARAAYSAGEKLLTHEPDMTISGDGYMRCYSIVYIPSEKEFQVTVKFNKTAYDKLGASVEDGFAFKLYDTASDKEFTDYTATRDSEGLYGYYRIVFSGVSFLDTSDLEVVMFPKDDDSKYSAIKIHKSGQAFEDYKLSEKEVASLEG